MNINTGHRETVAKKMLVHELFETQKEKTPEAIAIEFNNEQLTYHQLDVRAEVLSKAIYKEFPHSTIAGISTGRSVETIIGILAILKAGKAYLPLDSAYPKERLLQIIKDSGIDLILTTETEKNFFEDLGVRVLISDGRYVTGDVEVPRSNSSCYVLYTSGSTGIPKGVSMGHQALVNLLGWQQKNSESAPGFKTLQFAPLSFDVSFQEIFSTLITGGTLVLVEEDLRIDPVRLLHYISRNGINRIFLPFVVLQYLTEAADAEVFFPECLKEVMTAGEQLKITPQVVHFFKALPGCMLFNQYGPTETHVVTQLKLEGEPESWPSLPSIGKAIDHTCILMLDEKMQPVAAGSTGELCVSGISLADGYLNRPELTAEKFVVQDINGTAERIYRTGDLGRYLPDGNIEYLGRRDTQVKIRGNRVEPGEIEVLIGRLANIKQAVVVAREDIPGQKRLVAYLVPAGDTRDTAYVRTRIEQQLPDFMHPSAYVWLTTLPKTTSGKVDRKNLPKPNLDRPELDTPYKAASTVHEKNIATVWRELLMLEKIGTDDNFFQLGGNSILAMKTIAVLKQRFGYEVPVTRLYQFPSIGGLAAFVDGGNKTVIKSRTKRPAGNKNTDIAIIGMNCRFPGAASLEEFWNLLAAGREGIHFFDDGELDKSIPRKIKDNPAYVKARGIIDGADEFDAAFFGFTPRNAELMDPQQRIFLEMAWHLLEESGHLPQKYSGTVGVFAGCGYNTYFSGNVLTHPELVEKAGHFNVRLLNEKDYIATRTAYQLNLKGPAVAVYSACSTSLLAVAEAVNSIRCGECDVAIAGAASLTSPVKSGHFYEEGSIMSADGHCRPFDAAASGTVFSDGAGLVLLKSKESAERDGDIIHAIIKGVGINNDGAGKGSFGAPSAGGQAEAIAMSIDNAGIKPSAITYIEAHGTATPLGDPIEIEGLKLAFGEQEHTGFCAIGSVKSNLGHLTAASGAAGLIKTVLSLQHKQLAPTLHFTQLNPNINIGDSPFYINESLSEWNSEGLRYAGVSSFGVGGTNVHLTLEEYLNPAVVSGGEKPLSLLTWSAKTESSLDDYTCKLAEFTNRNPDAKSADIAFSLQNTRADFNLRRFTIAQDRAELAKNLSSPPTGAVFTRRIEAAFSEVVFMFPGQGSQYLNMGKDLYENEPVFAAAVDECLFILKDTPQADIGGILFPADDGETSAQKLKNTFYTQPAIFIMEYAMAKLWISWGIKPAVLTGHSIGEFVAGHFAGIFSLKDALLLISARADLVNRVERGSMFSVRLNANQLRDIIPHGLAIAAINSDKLCVVAGPDELIRKFADQLEEAEIPGRLLQTSHAFHSAMMDGIINPFEEIVKRTKLNPPVKPMVSTVTGSWITEAQATNPAYWAHHLRDTVKFADAIGTLQEDENRILLEVGPGNVLATLSRQQLKRKNISAIAGFEKNETTTEYYSVLRALGQLWLHGIEPDWKAYYQDQQRIKLKLPGYAFDKKRYWLEPKCPLDNVITDTQIPDDKPEPANNNELLMRTEQLSTKLRELFEDASGIEITPSMVDTSFIEIGFDSLLLTQVATNLKKEFNVPVTFRKLFEDYNTVSRLAAHLNANLPDEHHHPGGTAANVNRPAYNHQQPAFAVPAQQSAANTGLDLMQQQIQMLAAQLSLLQNAASGAPTQQPVSPAAPAPVNLTFDLTAEEQVEVKKPFGATARIEKQAQGLTAKQQTFLDELTIRYNNKTAASKTYTQNNRSYMADPRVVSGFRPLTKEIVYPIVVNRSKGSRVWDIDGNEYIDALNGFGSNFLGYQADVLKKAVVQQVENGYEIGPQHEYAGDVCRMICELTGFDRAALCNTGSEAVLGAMRIARTVTGRTLIVAFSGSYHGINDEVIVRGTKKLKTIPAAPGIMPEAVQNMLILDYGTDDSLRIIRERAHEIAAVLVEPVQSRRPEFRPVEFLKELRKVTEQSETVLIFDEVITGFRMHPGGAQAIFGIKADIGTYGKVIGGGMPVGAIAGKKRYMDALDGGFWQYGDDSQPEAGVTYFAGTFVRHPLALAAAKASLEYMKAKGPALQEGINSLTAYLAEALNSICRQYELPLYAPSFGSLWKIKFKEELAYGELLFTLMREKGIHIWDLFPCFLTESHTRDDADRIIAAFRQSVIQLVDAGFFPDNREHQTAKEAIDAQNTTNEAPIPGARLGRDRDGNPAWFINDANNPGKYLQVKFNGN